MVRAPVLTCPFLRRYFFNERPLQKVLRKLKEEPLVPLGTFLTCLAFYRAWRGVRTGNQVQAQRMFRFRVAAQAFTVAAMVAGGLYYSEDRRRSKEARKAAEAKDAEEKRAKWIRELEARDEEDKEVAKEVQKRKKAAAARREGTAKDTLRGEVDRFVEEGKASAQKLEGKAAEMEQRAKRSWGEWWSGKGKPTGDMLQQPQDPVVKNE